MLLALWLLACGPSSIVERVDVDEGQYWFVVPDGVDPATAPVLVHLHANGLGELTANSEGVQADLEAQGMVGVFPDGWGDSADEDWNVGDNRHDIPRDDVAFVTRVGEDLVSNGMVDLWLGGASKGGAMTYELACLGADSPYVGFVPMHGAIEKELPGPCIHPSRPIHHLQGRNDPDHWPLFTADRPESSHMGIMDSLLALTTTNDSCLDEPVEEDEECATWSCADTVRLCWHDGGHRLPPDWVVRQHRAIDSLR